MSAPTHAHPAITRGLRERLSRRIRLLVVFTVTYNVMEAAIALAAGAAAGSSALIGFGLDSVIEVSSAVAVAWQFAGPRPQEREKTALRVIALSFFALAAAVSLGALSSLALGQTPEPSSVGVALAAVSLLVMPTISLVQRRTGEMLGSHSAVADSQQTLLCSYMSAVLLVGLLAHSALGWWWADPVAALAIAALAVREGVNAWNGDACCSTEALFAHEDDHVSDEDAPSRGPGGGC